MTTPNPVHVAAGKARHNVDVLISTLARRSDEIGEPQFAYLEALVAELRKQRTERK